MNGSNERGDRDKQSRVYYIAKSMAEKRTPLTRDHYDRACSDYLQENTDERSVFGRAVGRVLSRAALLTSMGRSRFPTTAEFRMLFNTQTHHTLEDGLASLARRLPLSCEAFTLSLYYIDLLQNEHDGLVTWLNMERLFAVGIVLASKFAYDRVYTNNYYARVLGVDVAVLNRMEITMLRLLDFNLTPNPERWTQLHAFVASVAFEVPLARTPAQAAAATATAPTTSTATTSTTASASATVSAAPTPAAPGMPAPVPRTPVETPRLKRFADSTSGSSAPPAGEAPPPQPGL